MRAAAALLPAPVASVTARRLLRRRHLPRGHSSPCQSSPAPGSAALVFSAYPLYFGKAGLFLFTFFLPEKKRGEMGRGVGGMAVAVAVGVRQQQAEDTEDDGAFE